MEDNFRLHYRLLYSMCRIRMVEEEIAKRYPEGKMRCPTHLSIGQEAVPAALGELLYHHDFAVSTHRGHAHYLGKGGNLNAMIAEIYGKATGCSKGKGGSMHLVDNSAGFIGTSAIVGNSIPIGVGLALAEKIKGGPGVSVIFLGDGAVEEGAFYESVNFSILKNLPVVFVCENNLYSVYTPLAQRQPEGRKIYKMVEAMGIRSFHGDGNDVLKCFDLFQLSLNDIRSHGKPVFIELATYRWREHCGPYYDNDLGYRSIEEYEDWKQRDPIEILKYSLKNQDKNYSQKLQEILENIKLEIDSAFLFAEESPFPDPSEAYRGVYAD